MKSVHTGTYTYYKPAQNMKHSYNGIPAGGTSCLHLVHNVSISLQGSTRTCGSSVVPICNLKPWTVFQSKDFLCGTFSNVFQLHFKSVRDQPLFSQTSRCFPSTHLPTKNISTQKKIRDLPINTPSNCHGHVRSMSHLSVVIFAGLSCSCTVSW